jgi:hypothetical protein
MRPILILLLLLAFQPAGGPRAGEPVDRALVLLAEASGSIDDGEIMFQRQGYAEAITDPRVLEAIAGTGYGRIALIYVEWGAALSQEVVVGWTLIDGAATAAEFAAALMRPPRIAYGRNAIGAALLTGKRLIEENEFEGNRRVIDFSADSANNWYPPDIGEARAEVLAAGIVINGLAVLCRDCWSGRPVSYDLEKAFSEQIVGGPGSFVITADDAPSFAAAVRKKLILEIVGLPARFAAAGR